MRNVLHELFDGKLSRDQMEYEKGKAYSRAYDAAVVAEEELLETLTDKQKMIFRTVWIFSLWMEMIAIRRCRGDAS